jgi:hypothetical protein
MHALEPAWESVQRAFDSAAADAARTARSHLLRDLNQLFRRFRQYKNEEEWIGLLLEGASAFAPQLALFSLDSSTLRLHGQTNLDLPEGLSFPCSAAAAFETVRVSNDPVVALRTPAEVTPNLSSSDPSSSTPPRAHLFPISNAARVSAILFVCDQPALDIPALELIVGIASSVLERHGNSSLHAQIESPVTSPASAIIPPKLVNATSPHLPARSLPAWSDLDESQRQLHLRAQRFARVTVAQMQLSKPEACQAGREQGNLYLFLKLEIDKAREIYNRQFRTISSMVDYLHLELLRIPAEGDERKLGADYPGQLV